MKIEILDERENPLLDRKEIKFKVAYTGPTPKVSDVKKELVSSKKLDENLTVLDYVKSEYGSNTAICYAKVYANEDSMKIEGESKIKKSATPAEEPKEAAAEEKKEELKEGAAEEKKEEPKEEAAAEEPKEAAADEKKEEPVEKKKEEAAEKPKEEAKEEAVPEKEEPEGEEKNE